MQVQQIPKTFWHAVSLCAVVATLTLCVIAWKASSVNVEIADIRINLLSAAEETQKTTDDLKRRAEDLADVQKQLKAQSAELERKGKALVAARQELKVANPNFRLPNIAKRDYMSNKADLEAALPTLKLKNIQRDLSSLRTRIMTKQMQR